MKIFAGSVYPGYISPIAEAIYWICISWIYISWIYIVGVSIPPMYSYPGEGGGSSVALLVLSKQHLQ